MITSAVILSLVKTRSRPVWTFVAEMNTCGLGAARSASKSTKPSTSSLSGLMLSGLKSYGESARDQASTQAWNGEPSSGNSENQPVEHAALHGRQIAVEADRAPEIGEALARLLGPAAPESVGQHHRVHGPGRCAGHALDAQPLVREDVIDRAPGERAVRAASLQRQIDLLRACQAALGHRLRRGAERPDQAAEPRNLNPHVSLRGPAAIDRQVGAGDLGGRVRALVDRQRRHLVDGDELLGRLR